MALEYNLAPRDGDSVKAALDKADAAQPAEAGKSLVADTEIAKLVLIAITQAVDLDAIEARVNALDASVVLTGVWDASAGTFPTSTNAGESWIVSVAGTVDSVSFNVNDRIIAIVDTASTSVYTANWHKADYTDQVLSVGGQTGTITLADLNLVAGTDFPSNAQFALKLAKNDDEYSGLYEDELTQAPDGGSEALINYLTTNVGGNAHVITMNTSGVLTITLGNDWPVNAHAAVSILIKAINLTGITWTDQASFDNVGAGLEYEACNDGTAITDYLLVTIEQIGGKLLYIERSVV